MGLLLSSSVRYLTHGSLHHNDGIRQVRGIQRDRHCERTFTPEAGGEVKQSHSRNAQFIIDSNQSPVAGKSKIYNPTSEI
jgi:hypothetical protein